MSGPLPNLDAALGPAAASVLAGVRPVWLARYDAMSRLVPPTAFVRAETQDTLGPGGVLRRAAADAASFLHDGRGRNRGLACHPPRTNMLRANRALGDLGVWTHNNGLVVTQDAVGLDGLPGSAFTLADVGTGASWLGQQLSIATTAGTHVASACIRKAEAGASQVRLELRLQGGTVRHCGLWLDSGSGAALVDGSLAPPANVLVRDLGAWWEAVLAAENDGGNDTVSFRLRPAAGTVPGTASSSATGSVVVDMPQVLAFARRVPAAPITTGATEEGCEGDAAEMALPRAPWPALSLAVAWFAEGDEDELARVVELNDGTGSNLIAVGRSGGSTVLNVVAGGVFVASLALGPWSAGRHAAAVRIAPDAVAGCLDGGEPVEDHDATVPPVDRLLPGRSIGAHWLGGPVAAVAL